MVTSESTSRSAASNGLQTVERSLKVLDLVASQPERAWSLSELTSETLINKSTMFRILATLESLRYLRKDLEDKSYRLGPAAISLGFAASVLLRRIALPVMRELSARTGETVLLHVLSDVSSLCIEKIESRHPVRVTYDVGRRGPLHAGTSGKTLLAFMSESEFEHLVPRLEFRRYTDLTITDIDTLRAGLGAIRSRGYAMSFGELDEGVTSVGAPIWNSQGRLEAGIALVGPAVRWTESRSEEYIRETIAAAEEVSAELGYQIHTTT